MSVTSSATARLVTGAFCESETPPYYEPERQCALDVCALLEGVESEAEAFELCLRRRAERTASFVVGLTFSIGLLGQEPNSNKAIHFLAQASAWRHPIAEYILDVRSVFKTLNSRNAKKHLLRAKRTGLKAGAYTALASACDSPSLLYSKGAQIGDVRASVKLGGWYEYGYRMEQNYQKALVLYENAVKEHDPMGCHHLAHLMGKLETPHPRGEAVMRKAASEGCLSAQHFVDLWDRTVE